MEEVVRKEVEVWEARKGVRGVGKGRKLSMGWGQTQ